MCVEVSEIHDAMGNSRENNDKPVADCYSLCADTGDSSATYDLGVYGHLTGHNHNGRSCVVEASSYEDGSVESTCCVEVLVDHPVMSDASLEAYECSVVVREGSMGTKQVRLSLVM